MMCVALSLSACGSDSEGNANKPVPASEVETRTLGLPNGATIAVAKGSTAELLAGFLASPDPAPRSFELGEVQFGDWSADANPVTDAKLAGLVQILKAYPDTQITLIGHSDGAGNPDDNLKISKERAEVAKEALTNAGISGTRIETDGAGMTRPIADNATVEGRSRNRRVELVVTEK